MTMMIVIQSCLGLVIIIWCVILAFLLFIGISYVIDCCDKVVKRRIVLGTIFKYMAKVLNILTNIIIISVFIITIITLCYQIGSSIMK